MKVKTKRRICVAVGLLAFLAMLGIVGGMERELIAVGKGAVRSWALRRCGRAG